MMFKEDLQGLELQELQWGTCKGSVKLSINLTEMFHGDLI